MCASSRTKSTSKILPYTEDDLFNILNEEFQFTCEICATEKTTRCVMYLNSHQEPWEGTCWLVPKREEKYIKYPYWVSRAKAQKDQALTVALLPVKSNAAWWELCLEEEIRFIQGRFLSSEPKAIVIFGGHGVGTFKFPKKSLRGV